MPNQRTPLSDYLYYLETYLKGDLESFHQTCAACEAEEKANGISMDGRYSSTSSMSEGSAGPRPTTSTSTTTETTRMPPFFQGLAGLPKFFRSTIPHTQTLFSTIDTLGFLLRIDNDYGKTWKNFESFFQGSSMTPTEKDVLLNVYRHGMMHSYFPKLGVGISYQQNRFGSRCFSRAVLVD